MKKLLTLLTVVGFTFATISFSTNRPGAIKGMVSPANAGARVIAVSKRDTASSSIYQGMFQLNNLRPGTYTVTVVAIPPYKNVSKKLIVVTGEATTDVGYFFLEK